MRFKNFLTVFSAAVCFCGVMSCNKEDDKNDLEKPVFVNTDATPVEGGKYLPGGKIIVHQTFSDNEELGSFNIEIHNNFDGHSHSTETSKSISKHEGHDHEHGDVENAWVFNQDYQIPAGEKQYTADLEIQIPETIAEGDYHFMIRVTDKAGWQEIKAVSLEIED
ncbi:MAG: DUF4625 domain-containing protein [Bacteroidales bacterium]|nr:DUF4625 domain-containing protein [Bacteroidales bacterium]